MNFAFFRSLAARLLAAGGLAAALAPTSAAAQTPPLVDFPPVPLVKLAVNPVTNKAYVVNEGSDSVTVIDAGTGATSTIPVGPRPHFIAVNPVTNRIYVNNSGNSSLTVIDGATDINITPTPIGLGSHGPITVNPLTNTIYVVRLTSPATDEVTFVNGDTHEFYTIATESFQPMPMAVNPLTNTIYVGHYATGDVRIISGAYNAEDFHPQTFSLGMWSRPFAVVANPVTNLVYVITEDSRGPIAVIDGAARTAVFPAVESGHAVGPKSLAVNPVTNKAYAAFNDEMIVIDGATNALTYVPIGPTGTGPVEIAVNPATNKIYVAKPNGALAVIDGTTLATSEIAIPEGAMSLGINTVTNQVFVLGATLTIVDGASGSLAVPPAASITPLPGDQVNATSASITIQGSSSFSPNTPPIARVYYQLDSTEGAWTPASGSGPYTADLTGLTPGTHTLHAFATDVQLAQLSTGAQSAPLTGGIASYTFTVGPPPPVDPSISLASSGSPADHGTNVTFTATVTGSAGTPTGPVEFRDGTTAIAGCESLALSGGTATCVVSLLEPGTHSITARYSGSTAYNPRTSAAISQVINPPPKPVPTVTATTSQNPSTEAQPVTFTATVSGGAGTPTGQVAFRRNGDPIFDCGNRPLSGGTAICTTASLPQGSFQIDAEYLGDATYARATSPAFTQVIQIPITESGVNYALAANGGSVIGSSNGGSGFPQRSLNNGDRTGAGWGSSGGWKDGTPNQYPDWVNVFFSGTRTIDRVVVYSLQDDPLNPVEPSDTMTFTAFGATAFQVQGWNGSTWVTLATVSGNNLVKRTVTFTPYTTMAIRVEVHATPSNHTRLVEIEAYGAAPEASINVALASSGGTPAWSSAGGPGFPAASLINGDRRGLNWGSGGGWKDGTADEYPDWAQIQFSGAHTIDRVVVYSLQDDPFDPEEPSDSTTFTAFGATSMTVQAWNGSAWVDIASTTGNNLVKRTFTFAPVTTDRIRVNVNATPSNFSRLVEIEAWTVGGAGGGGVNHAMASQGASVSTSSNGGSAFPAASLIDGELAGAKWGAGGGWKDGTASAYPDWVQVDFSNGKTIDRVVVVSLQDDPFNPVEPTDTTTFTAFGASSFTVEGWTGSGWQVLATVNGNNLVKRTVSFAPFATPRIRVNVLATPSNHTRLVEVEAWGS